MEGCQAAFFKVSTVIWARKRGMDAFKNIFDTSSLETRFFHLFSVKLTVFVL